MARKNYRVRIKIRGSVVFDDTLFVDPKVGDNLREEVTNVLSPLGRDKAKGVVAEVWDKKEWITDVKIQ